MLITNTDGFINGHSHLHKMSQQYKGSVTQELNRKVTSSNCTMNGTTLSAKCSKVHVAFQGHHSYIARNILIITTGQKN